MKPRHAAAFALVGWYLMVPPPNAHRVPGPDYQCIAADDPQLSQYLDYPQIDGAPLWQWNTLAVFDDQEHCQEALYREFYIYAGELAHKNR